MPHIDRLLPFLDDTAEREVSDDWCRRIDRAWIEPSRQVSDVIRREHNGLDFWVVIYSSDDAWCNYVTAVPTLKPNVASAHDSLKAKFNELATQWREETSELSSVSDIVLHPAYQRIIAFGPPAIPFILKELEHEPAHWFWALSALSGGAAPVKAEQRGRMKEMAKAWLTWGRDQGFLP
jgi:hypothetical protein